MRGVRVTFSFLVGFSILFSELTISYGEDFWPLLEGIKNHITGKRYDEALKESEILLQQSPDIQTTAQARYLIAYCHYKQGKGTHSEEELVDIVSRFPESPEIERIDLRICQSYMNLKEYDQTRKRLEEFKKRHPRSFHSAVVEGLLIEIKGKTKGK